MPQVGALRRAVPVQVFEGWDIKKESKSPYAQKVPGPPALAQGKVKSSNRQVSACTCVRACGVCVCVCVCVCVHIRIRIRGHVYTNIEIKILLYIYTVMNSIVYMHVTSERTYARLNLSRRLLHAMYSEI